MGLKRVLWDVAIKHMLNPSLKRALELASRGKPSYDENSLTTWHQSVDFLSDPKFIRAYNAGMDSGHQIMRPAGSNEDIKIKWRVAVSCWAAHHAAKLDGDFVECGVNTGIISLAICEYLGFNDLNKTFWLFDTYQGIPEEQISPAEKALGRGKENPDYYPPCYEIAKKNFAPYPRAKLVKGRVPEILTSVVIDKVAYLSLDMNIAAPERAAIEYFWPKLVPGAVIVMDDYGWAPYRAQKTALDEFARSQGVEIMALPTGQGFLIKS
jgi:hypothetical protein